MKMPHRPMNVYATAFLEEPYLKKTHNFSGNTRSGYQFRAPLGKGDLRFPYSPQLRFLCNARHGCLFARVCVTQVSANAQLQSRVCVCVCVVFSFFGGNGHWASSNSQWLWDATWRQLPHLTHEGYFGISDFRENCGRSAGSAPVPKKGQVKFCPR